MPRCGYLTVTVLEFLIQPTLLFTSPHSPIVIPRAWNEVPWNQAIQLGEHGMEVWT